MKKTAKKLYRIRNWSEYNEALIKRGSVTLWLVEEVIEEWLTHQKSGKPGASDYYSETAIECMLKLEAIYDLGLRGSQGLMQSIFALMGVELAVPHYTTLSRRRKRLAVSLGVKASKKAVHLVVDATGVKLYGEGEWKVRQHGCSKRRTWLKVHLGVDESSNEILAALLSTNSLTDGQCLEDLLDQLQRPIKQVSGDGAYDKRTCYQAIAAKKARAAIPPQHRARIWRHGNTAGERHARDENLREIRRHGRAAWKRSCQYHRRSKAETAMFRFKTIFGEKLSARNFDSQAVEVFIKCALLNTMMRLGMPDTDPRSP